MHASLWNSWYLTRHFTGLVDPAILKIPHPFILYCHCLLLKLKLFMHPKYISSPLGSKHKYAKLVMWLRENIKLLDKLDERISAATVKLVGLSWVSNAIHQS